LYFPGDNNKTGEFDHRYQLVILATKSPALFQGKLCRCHTGMDGHQDSEVGVRTNHFQNYRRVISNESRALCVFRVIDFDISKLIYIGTIAMPTTRGRLLRFQSLPFRSRFSLSVP